MILVGQYDSPFVRRVGIALDHYAIRFDHRPWSVFTDARRLATINPLIRVPVLVLDSGTSLTDSHMILDYLDHLVGPERALCPLSEPTRHRVQRIMALTAGLAEKAVTLFYEQRMHSKPSPEWAARLTFQITSTLTSLEHERASRRGPWWFSQGMTHADIMLACGLHFISEALAELVPLTPYPTLRAEMTRIEALPLFRQHAQALHETT